MDETPDPMNGDEPERDASEPAVAEDAPAEEPEFEITSQQFPWEITLKSFSWWIQKYPNGAVELKFAGSQNVPTPQGIVAMPMPPGVSIVFPNEEVFGRFREHVAAGEVPKPSPVQPVAAAALDHLRDRKAVDQAALRRIRR